MKLTKEQLSSMLQERWGYEPHLIDDVVRQLSDMDRKLQESFQLFVDSEIQPDEPMYFGLTPSVISKNYKLAPPAVFLILEWIQKDPESGLEFLVSEYHKPLPDEFDPAALFEWKKSQAE